MARTVLSAMRRRISGHWPPLVLPNGMSIPRDLFIWDASREDAARWFNVAQAWHGYVGTNKGKCSPLEW
jgi:hypothetical protein